ncbi:MULTISPECIES: hypothetical protein [Rhizobium]|uniref:EF-hand domain-containing protein n=1 Tax=Rhizobium altiplani TaxID=1864509 RepID=A0A125Q7H3_9HYPH|nr:MULTISPECIES: hypothetical protein [Rhizobium]KWV51080.1 hypothetical protein AS026_07060 [Rhizobium altiplani]
MKNVRVNSDSSVYSLMMPTSRKAPSVSDEKLQVVSAPKAPAVRSDDQLIDDFYARLTKQQLDWADSNKDSTVTKSEYMDSQARLAKIDNRVFDPATAEQYWNKLDPTGKGWLDESELREGYENLLPVSVGHLDANYAERLRTRQG